MSPPTKRQRLPDHDADGSGSDMEPGGEEDEEDTNDEIEHLQRQKSKKTAKRKIRATGSATFGATLQLLIDTNTPSSLPLALKPSVAKKRKDEQLEKKAQRVLHVERKEKEDKNRIRDVIGGWGGENERALRKVAQRGVIKLFNAIQQAQTHAAAAEEEKKRLRGSGKATLAAPDINGKKKEALDKDQFFELIKAGGMVSKA